MRPPLRLDRERGRAAMSRRALPKCPGIGAAAGRFPRSIQVRLHQARPTHAWLPLHFLRGHVHAADTDEACMPAAVWRR
ncbi:hypothetical protein JR064_03735 [Xanthomonas sp. CFBP 8703]|uniref:Uncharacterized protein n=1 Tax=Xanthomonas bonasiae TaxID=2810351 RepID=A0ABS3B112_9XANT|nr:hypothetical protein [Xanthomonas bonasiae]MBN6101275.1 hypothetical protein [Xanthomonas bonasiae]